MKRRPLVAKLVASVPLQATPVIGERTLPEDDDAREGFGAVCYRFGALDDVDLVVGIDADLGAWSSPHCWPD